MARLFCIACAFLMTACTLGPYDARELGSLPPAPSTFQATLKDGYVVLGDRELKEYDWTDAARFYRRATAAAKGEAFDPELIASRFLSDEAKSELTAARADLIELLNNGARALAGASAARAQTGFDCWMQEIEEGHQPGDIAGCRDGFVAALAETRKIMTGALVVLLPDRDGGVGAVNVSTGAGTVTLDAPRASAVVAGAGAAPSFLGLLDDSDISAIFAGALSAEPSAPVTFILYFEQGADVLTAESRAKLPEVLKTIRERIAARVDISGHTDTAGSASLNDRLALGRARIVEQTVLGLGIAADAVRVEAFGERDLLVPTADGVNEPRNRRVEIVVR